MTLTVREPTLIIYLAANGFMIYTVYCAMKIFFDQPPVNRRRTLLCYALYPSDEQRASISGWRFK